MSHLKNILNLFKAPLQTAQTFCKAANPLQYTQIRTEYSWPGYGSRYGFTNWPMKKDYMKRQIVKDGHAKRMRLRALRKNRILPADLQEIVKKESREMPMNTSTLILKNRCVLTGRGRGCRQKYRISRIMFKHFADYGKLSGIKRACW